jgi:hypothetical protein
VIKLSIVTYFIFFLLGIILILIIALIVQTLRIKNYQNKERRLFNQKLIERDKFKQNLKEKKDFYNEKAKNASNINDLLDLTDKLLSDGYHPT